MQALLPLLSYMIPMLGKALLMIPFIPNKAIPFVLGALNVGHKYWVLLGFPAFMEMGSAALGGPVLAGFSVFSALPVVWGLAEQYLFHRFYEGKKLEARVNAKTSWWESGKRSMF